MMYCRSSLSPRWRMLLLGCLGFLFLHPRSGFAQADSLAPRPFTFAVVGHVRGNSSGALNPKLGELLERVREEHPDFVLLAGDLVWGDIDHDPPDTAVVRQEWEHLDSALATLGVPVYRVPGNHDISDPGTRDLWRSRYGRLPRVLQRHGSRFILLRSPWVPAQGDTRHLTITRPEGLDSAQVEWLRTELARPGNWDNTFVVMHHLFWWNPDAPWWTRVHPLLAKAGVRMVFGGDYGPLKFSYLTRDSVRYVQSSMEGLMTLRALRRSEMARVLSSQFDNFLVVHVNGPSVDLRVRTLGEFSSPQYQPAVYRAMMPQQPSLWRRRLAILTSPKWLAAMALLALGSFVAGVWLGRGRRRSGG